MPRHRKPELANTPEVDRLIDLLLEDAQARNLDTEAFEAGVVEVLARAAEKVLSARAAKAVQPKPVAAREVGASRRRGSRRG